MKKIKIITISSNDLGISYGPSVHYLELWNRVSLLKKDKYEVVGIYPSWTKKPPILKPKFKLIKVPVPNITRLRQVIFNIFVVVKLIKYIKSGYIVYIRISSMQTLIRLTLKLFKIKPIVELNGIMECDHKSSKTLSFLTSFFSKEEIKFCQLAKLVICVSNSISTYASKYCEKVATIYNGVSDKLLNVKQLLVTENSKISIIYVGTYTPWDGSTIIPRLAKKYSHINFIMVGDGPNKKVVKQASTSNMIFHGWAMYGQLHNYYKNCHAGIVLYEQERHDKVELSSLKSLEYIAAGLPIFTTNVKGQEWIEENKLGTCVDFSNIDNAFAEFIENLSKFQKNVDSYRKKNIEKISWSQTARNTIKELENIF